MTCENGSFSAWIFASLYPVPRDDPCHTSRLGTNLNYQAELTSVPTEFGSLLEYQKVMSQLLLKETLSGLQQELGSRKSGRKFVHINGQVSLIFPSYLVPSVWFTDGIDLASRVATIVDVLAQQAPRDTPRGSHFTLETLA